MKSKYNIDIKIWQKMLENDLQTTCLIKEFGIDTVIKFYERDQVSKLFDIFENRKEVEFRRETAKIKYNFI